MQIPEPTRVIAARTERDSAERTFKFTMSGPPRLSSQPSPLPPPGSLLCPSTSAQLWALALCPKASSHRKLRYARENVFPYPLYHCHLASQLLSYRSYSNSVLLTVSDFIFLVSKITTNGECSHEIKRRLLLGRKVMTNLDSIFKRRDYFANKGPSSQGYGFSSSHVWMWKLDSKESWAPKNWCF